MLHPDRPGYERNDSSCVLQITSGNSSVLLPGDIERASERHLLAQRDVEAIVGGQDLARIPGDPGDDPGDPGDEPDGPLSWDEKVGELAIDCAIKDDQPITNDFWVVNVGTQILPAGTMIRWRVPATGEHGAFLLPKDIPVGEERVLVDFLADVPIGSECRIQIIA